MIRKHYLPVIRFVPCHRKPERSFFYRGRQFPVCARCTGMLVGYLAFPLFLVQIIHMNIFTALALNIPAYIDGVIQAINLRESNNPLRFITGMLSGIGQMGVVSFIGNCIGLFIVKKLKGEI